MTRLLAAVGELSYNGVTFPGPTRASINSTPIYDQADRSVKYVKHKLRVETYFCHDDTALVTGAPAVAGADPHVNNIVDYIRLRLTKVGAELRLREKGFGLDVRVNGVRTAGRAPGVYYDAEFGPKPRVLAWQPVGDNRTVKVVWEVEFNIPECCQYPTQDVPLERTYTVDWSIDAQGLTTRVIEGRVEATIARIPLAAGLRMNGNADDFRHWAFFPIPLGFVRTQKYKLSEDRRVLLFTLTDQELPSDYAFTPGTLKMDAEQTVSSRFLDGNAGGFVKWDCSIRATITLPKNQTMGIGGLPKSLYGRKLAWIAFKEILDEKIWKVAKRKGRRGILKIPGKVSNSSVEDAVMKTISKGGATFIPDEISMREDLYGREFNFEFKYTIFCMPDRVFESTRILHQNGPGTGKTTADFLEYLKYTGGRAHAPSAVSKDNVGATESKPFGMRGELGGVDLAGREASYFGSNPTFRPAVWTEDIIYDYCESTGNPGIKIDAPKKDIPKKHRYDPKTSGVEPEPSRSSGGDTASSYFPEDGPGKEEGIGGDQKCLAYVCNFTHEELGATITHTRVGQTSSTNYAQDYVASDQIGDDSGNRYRAVATTNELHSADRPKIQSLGPPQHLVRITGYAYQLGYTRTPPATIKWGKDCTLHRISKQSTVSQVSKGALPVYMTTWDILYNADNSPNGEPFKEAIAATTTTGILSNQST